MDLAYGRIEETRISYELVWENILEIAYYKDREGSGRMKIYLNEVGCRDGRRSTFVIC
jgi:hypothetical protein